MRCCIPVYDRFIYSFKKCISPISTICSYENYVNIWWFKYTPIFPFLTETLWIDIFLMSGLLSLGIWLVSSYYINTFFDSLIYNSRLKLSTNRTKVLWHVTNVLNTKPGVLTTLASRWLCYKHKIAQVQGFQSIQSHLYSIQRGLLKNNHLERNRKRKKVPKKKCNNTLHKVYYRLWNLVVYFIMYVM